MGGDQRRDTVPGTGTRLCRLGLRVACAVVIAGGAWLICSAVDSGTALAAEQPSTSNTASSPGSTDSGLLGALGGSVDSVLGTVNTTLDSALNNTVGTVNSVVDNVDNTVSTLTGTVTRTVPVQPVLPVLPVVPVVPVVPAPAPVTHPTAPVVAPVTTPAIPPAPVSRPAPHHQAVSRPKFVLAPPPAASTPPTVTAHGGTPTPDNPAPAPQPTPDLVAPVVVPAHNSSGGAHRLLGVLTAHGTARLPVRWVTAAPRLATATGGPLGLPSTSPD